MTGATLFRARRYSNARAEKRTTFRAETVDDACRFAMEFDWDKVLTVANFELADMGDEDVLVDIELADGSAEMVAEGMRTAESSPYSWEAVAFVHRVAKLSEEGYIHAGQTLETLIREATALCKPETAAK